MSDPAAGDLTNSVGMCVPLHPGYVDLTTRLVQYNTLILSHVFHLGLLGFEILGLDFWISGTTWFVMDKLVQILGSQGGYRRA
jgi:hypothetical protein